MRIKREYREERKEKDEHFVDFVSYPCLETQTVARRSLALLGLARLGGPFFKRSPALGLVQEESDGDHPSGDEVRKAKRLLLVNPLYHARQK